MFLAQQNKWSARLRSWGRLDLLNWGTFNLNLNGTRNNLEVSQKENTFSRTQNL